MLFDLHNDLLTAVAPKDFGTIAIRYSDELAGAVLAFWSTNYSEIPEFEIPKRNNLYFAVEDMHFFDPSKPKRLLELKPVYCGLTWNYDNGLAGGAYSDGGLTDKGKEVIDFLNDNDIAVDLAHLNERSFFEIIERANRPIVSHAFVSEFHAHKRNISFRQIESIVERRGVIGLTPVNDFTGGGLGAFVRGIATLIDRFGDDNFAIGTDINGSKDFPEELGDYKGYDTFAAVLIALGYDDETINKITHLNAAKYVGNGGLP